MSSGPNCMVLVGLQGSASVRDGSGRAEGAYLAYPERGLGCSPLPWVPVI